MNGNTASQLTLYEMETKTGKNMQKLRLNSDLSYENAHELVHEVSTSLVSEPEKIVLDMSEANMMDSSGLRALLQCKKLCEEANVRFYLKCVSEPVVRIIGMSGFAPLFDLPQVEVNALRKHTQINPTIDDAGWKVCESQAISDASFISILRCEVIDAAREAGAVGETLCDIQIAVGEALTNAYRHGSPQKGVNKIRMRCMTCMRAIVVEIEDEGNEFDPDAISEPDPKQMRDHGMGIYLMRQAMDVVEFHTGCPGNRVRMIKWLGTPPS